MTTPAQQTDGGVQLPVQNDEDVATLLSAPSNLSTLLSASAKVYGKVTASATSILTKSSVDLNAFKSGDPDDKTTGMREMIETVKADFTRFADREVDLCKNLKAYGTLLNTLLPKLEVPTLFTVLNGRVEAFRKVTNEDANERAARAAQILKYVEILKTRLGDATAAVAILSQQATAMEEQLRRQNVGQRLIEALKKVFRLEDDEDGALTQLSIILGIAKAYLESDFETLSKNKKQMQAFIDKVKALQTGLEKVRQSLVSMTEGMKTSVDANATLVGVWDTMAANLTRLKTYGKAPVGASDQLKINISWKKAQTAADEAITTITGGAVTAAISVGPRDAPSSVTHSSVQFPTSRAELELFKMAGDAGVDHMVVEPEKFSTLSYLAQLPDLAERQFTLSTRMATDSTAVSGDSKTAAEELMKKLGPPAIESIKNELSTLAGDCNQVKDTFSNILQVPFLQNLSILNPFRAANPVEAENINMRELVQRYKDKYNSLQDETVVVVKGLIAYSALQLILLPRVELDPAKALLLKPGDGKIPAEAYYKACNGAIASYLASATDIRTKHTNFKNEWAQAQINITQKINECKEIAKNLKKRIEEKKEEYKKKTIIGVLEILGGVACFALGFFVPFLAPAAWSAGAALIGIGIKELIDRGILDDAINELTSKLNAATSAATQLETLKAPFKLVETKIENLVGIWNGIEQALVSINMNVSTLKDAGPGVIEVLWGALLPENTKNWQTCKDLCTQYINAIH